MGGVGGGHHLLTPPPHTHTVYHLGSFDLIERKKDDAPHQDQECGAKDFSFVTVIQIHTFPGKF